MFRVRASGVYPDVRILLAEGRIPCAAAVMNNRLR